MNDALAGQDVVRAEGAPQVKVTVAVAVYNPGDAINDLLVSIDEQSLPPEEFEVIFADDDSTDGTRERLQEWAASRPHVRVLHNTPNSGWPGRPRNLAIDAAAGEFVFFADNDDKLATRALQWMYDYAIETDADVVIAKEVGVGPGRTVPRHIFRRNIADAKLGTHHILAILTPHKLVRTSMVREHGIRFPEGPFRLEDHLFIVACYFAARRISVLADHLCYYWMRRSTGGENASLTPFDPVMYYQCVEQIFELVEANTEPGPLREKLYAHWYDRKMLLRLRGGSLLPKPVEYQEAVFDELRRLSKRFDLGEAQWRWLGAGARTRSYLLEHGTLEQIRLLGEAERAVTSHVSLDDVTWTNDNQLRIRLHAHLIYSDGTPIRSKKEGDSVYWDTDELVPGMGLPKINISDLTPRVGVSLLVSDRKTEEVEYLLGTNERTDGDVLGGRADVTLDVPRLAATHPAGTLFDLRYRLIGGGWGSERRIPVGTRDLPEARAVSGMIVEPYQTQQIGNLSVAMRTPEHHEARVRAAAAARTRASLGGRTRAVAGRAKRRATRLVKRVNRRVKRTTQNRRDHR